MLPVSCDVTDESAVVALFEQVRLKWSMQLTCQLCWHHGTKSVNGGLERC